MRQIENNLNNEKIGLSLSPRSIIGTSLNNADKVYKNLEHRIFYVNYFS